MAGLCGLSRPVGILLRCLSCGNTLCLSVMSVSRRFKRALCSVSLVRRLEGGFSLLLQGGERCCQMGLAPSSLWIFSSHRRSSTGDAFL